MAPRARATRALALAAFVSAWTFACVTTFSRVPATPPERSGRFPTREDDARARAVFDAHAGHAAFAASARGAFESRSRGVDPFPRPYGTARVVDGASNAERFDVHAGHAGFRASSDASSRWRSADYDHPPAFRRPSEDAVGMESAPELELDPSLAESADAGARSPPDTDHVDAIDQLDPHEVAVILVDDPTRPDETPLKEQEEERRDQHRPQRHLRERDDGATDEGVGGRASMTTKTKTETKTETTTSSSTRGRPRHRPRPYDGVVRVVVAATRARRKHLTRRLLPALRDASDDADALDVRVHTSDADLCDAVLAADPRTRCEATETETDAGSSAGNPFPEDSAARREWYLRETADMIAALESAEAGGDEDDDGDDADGDDDGDDAGDDASASASASAVLFLEDDVIPATSWETKLRTLVGRHATRDDATSTWLCDFDMLSLYAAGWDSGEDGHVGAFSSGTQALFFCPGGAREMARKLRETFGEAPPDWLVRDATRDAKVRFAVPSLFQHGCERSTLAEKEFRHASKTFRFPATKCLKESDDADEVEVEGADEGARGGDGEGNEGTVGVVVPH